MGGADSLSLLVSIVSVEQFEIPKEVNTRGLPIAVRYCLLPPGYSNEAPNELDLLFRRKKSKNQGVQDLQPLNLHQILCFCFCALFVSH